MNVKLKYVRPCVEFIDFSLTSSVASTCRCQWEPLSADNVCKARMTDNGWIVFTVGDANGMCNIDISDYPDFCYHVPTDSKSVFSS